MERLHDTLRAAVGLGLLAAILVGGCSSTPENETYAQMVRVLNEVGAKTSASAERIGDIRWYDADDLHEYLDGAAETYLDAGFMRLAQGEWRAAGAKGPGYVELDLYDMGSPAGALDALADDRSPRADYLNMGDEALRTDAGLELRVGRYFVRLTARKEIGQQQDLVRVLAAAVTQAVPPGPPDAALVEPLPAANLLPHTANYYTHGFLGHDFLQRVRAATYEARGKRVELFVMDPETVGETEHVMEQWRAALPPAPIGAAIEMDTLNWDQPYVGHVQVIRKGRWVAGAVGDPDAGAVLLKPLVERLD
jgi:hypothetical protein